MSVNIALEIFAAVIALLLFITSILHKWKDKADYIITYIHFFIFCALFVDSLFEMLRENGGSILVQKIIIVPDYFLTTICCVLYHQYFTYWIKANITMRRWIDRTVHGIAFTMMFAWFLSSFTGWFFYFDSVDGYTHGPLYWVSQVGSALIIVIDMVLIITYRKLLGRQKCILFAIYGSFPVLMIPYTLITGEVISVYIGLLLVDLLIYTMLNLNREKAYKNLAREMEEDKSKLLAAQIKPHFIYNVLTTILFLCDEDINQTKYAIKCLSDYLRYNQVIMGDKDIVTFDEERNHVRDYLELEKIRFDDKLNVKWDIKVDDFKMPALCVQPIVENAVKHGIKDKMEPGTVTISTEETKEEYIITIADDGIGFDVNTYMTDGKYHIGYENVKKRIELLGNGRIELKSKIGEGTVAKIYLPKEIKKE